MAEALDAGFSPAEMVLAGWTPEELGAELSLRRKGGLTAEQAVLLGFSKGNLAMGGYTLAAINSAHAALRAGAR